MTKFNSSLLSLRLKQKDSQKKVTALAEMSKDGNLSSFSGIFKTINLSEHEKETEFSFEFEL